MIEFYYALSSLDFKNLHEYVTMGINPVLTFYEIFLFPQTFSEKDANFEILVWIGKRPKYKGLNVTH